jgi:DNA-binding NarL/FixJ family response regulator
MSPQEGASTIWHVLLADDHAVLREGLALLIETQVDMRVVGQARSGREAVAQALHLKPHVAVLDVSMADMDGIQAAALIHEQAPAVRTLALTRHADQGYLNRMLRAGVSGYVVKQAASEALIGAIRTVATGGTYIDPGLAGGLVARAFRQPERGTAGAPRPSLSEREEQVLRLIAWGKSNKEVAAQLNISVKTAEFYKASALDKLRLRSRTDILRHALAEHWLGVDDDPE